MADHQRVSTRFTRTPARYEPLNRIAVGGMAEVWRARAVFEDGHDMDVAIKRVLPAIVEPVFREMFRDEARLGMMLKHDNIVRVYDARDIGGTYIMVMELVDGESLRSLMKMAHADGAKMPPGAALWIGREVAQALAYAHDAKNALGEPLRIAHRDVSPHNILLGRDGTVKLTDFGLADAEGHTAGAHDVVGGKVGYLAPETIQKRTGDRRTDLFALGVVLWEMLAGKRLFYAKSDAQTLRNIVRCHVPPIGEDSWHMPSGVDELFAQLLAPEPADRADKAQVVVDALTEILSGLNAKIGPRDIGLVTTLHLARKAALTKSAPVPIEPVLTAELERFVELAANDPKSSGASPLDPNEFESED